MITIHKGKEPRELVEYRSAPPHGGYQGFADKDALRHALTREQGHLCAYCMQRIEPSGDKMKIEHYLPQDTHPEHALSYANMLGACKGGEGLPHARQHCDTRKGNALLSIDPRSAPERTLSYLRDGTIASSDHEIQRDIDEVLNLNTRRLRENRKAAWDGLLAALKRRGHQGFTEASLTRTIERVTNRNERGKLPVFCGMLVYLLTRKLHKVRARR